MRNLSGMVETLLNMGRRVLRPTAKTILMYACQPHLHLDKRIILTCNSMCEAGHRVILVTRPQAEENANLLNQILHPNAEVRLIDISWIVPLVQEFQAENKQVARLFVRDSGSEVVRKNQFLQDEDPSERPTSDFFTRCLGATNYLKFHDSLAINPFAKHYLLETLKVALHHRLDAIFCHDLWTLPPGVMFKSRYGGQLIYDAHEIGTTVMGDPTAAALAERYEPILYAAVDSMVTINQSFANYYRERFASLSPQIVVNAPPRYERAPSHGRVKAVVRDPQIPTGVIVGMWGHIYGLDKLFEAMTLTARPMQLVVIGDGAALPRMKEIAQGYGLLNNRIFFAGSMPFYEVVPAIVDANFGVIPSKRVINNGLNSPSKTYEYIQASLPIFASDEPEIVKLVNEYKIGKTWNFDQETPRVFAEQLDEFLNEVEAGRYSESLQRAKSSLVWPHDYSRRVLKCA